MCLIVKKCKQCSMTSFIFFKHFFFLPFGFEVRYVCDRIYEVTVYLSRFGGNIPSSLALDINGCSLSNAIPFYVQIETPLINVQFPGLQLQCMLYYRRGSEKNYNNFSCVTFWTTYCTVCTVITHTQNCKV